VSYKQEKRKKKNSANCLLSENNWKSTERTYIRMTTRAVGRTRGTNHARDVSNGLNSEESQLCQVHQYNVPDSNCSKWLVQM
jgi:hypothetical protein